MINRASARLNLHFFRSIEGMPSGPGAELEEEKKALGIFFILDIATLSFSNLLAVQDSFSFISITYRSSFNLRYFLQDFTFRIALDSFVLVRISILIGFGILLLLLNVNCFLSLSSFGWKCFLVSNTWDAFSSIIWINFCTDSSGESYSRLDSQFI